jgi:chromosome segregation ATPase
MHKKITTYEKNSYYTGAHISDIKQTKQHIKDLKQREEEINRQIREIQTQEAVLLERVKEAKQQVKILEKLKEKQYDSYNQAFKKEQEKELEQLIQLKYT